MILDFQQTRRLTWFIGMLYIPVILLLSGQVIANAPLSYKVLESHPHDSYLFTQGMILRDGKIYESSGLYKQSFLRIYDAQTGRIKAQRRLPRSIFAEGLEEYNDLLYLLTWKEKTLYILNKDTLKTLLTLPYRGEGWGLTHDGKDFIMSDGSNQLKFRDSQTFQTKRILPLSNYPGIPRLNELEYAKGFIWANVWQYDVILKISPEDGKVVGVLDLSELSKINNIDPGRTVLNGIAYDEKQDAFWVTGKNWPNRYLIKVDSGE